MRIGLMSTFPPHECGIATYTRDLEEALRKTGVETFILSSEGAKGDNVHEVMTVDNPSFAARAFDVTSRLTPDLIHIQHEFGLYGPQRGMEVLNFMTRLKFHGIPLATTFHTVNPKATELEQNITVRIVEECDIVIVHEKEHLSTLEKWCGIAALEKIRVIPHGIRNVQPVPHAKEKLGLEGHKIVLMCGYYRPSKGFHRALDFMPAVLDKHPDVRLVISGKTRQIEFDQYRKDLLESFRKSEISDRVTFFKGQFPQHTFDTILSAADVVAMPYEAGAQSGIMAQCMAMETPVVGSDLPAFINALELTGAGRCAANDTEFSAAIEEILYDAEVRDSISESIKNIKESKSWENTASHHLSVYRSMLPQDSADDRFIYVPESHITTRIPETHSLKKNMGFDPSRPKKKSA